MFFYKQGRGRTVYDVRDQIAEIYFTLSFFSHLWAASEEEAVL